MKKLELKKETIADLKITKNGKDEKTRDWGYSDYGDCQ
jgi:hypothetical protein